MTDDPAAAAAPAEPASPAEPDRRLHAFLLDRLAAGVVDAVAAYVVLRLLVPHGPLAGLAVVLIVLAVVVVVGALLAVVLGRTGSSPGNAVLRLRTVDAATGAPLGARRALLRQLVLGLATLPTAGLGLAALAWTAVNDAGGRRRGWHDCLAGSVVLDARPVPAEPAPAEVPAHGLVNLTALRLVPASSAPPPDSRPAPARTPIPTPSTRPAAARWHVRSDTGECCAVEGLVLVGRRPEARPGEAVDRLLALPSADMSLSKTHAEVRVAADGGLVVADRGSSNGSVLLRRGAARRLSPGRPTTLLDGDLVRLGDRTLEVVREA